MLKQTAGSVLKGTVSSCHSIEGLASPETSGAGSSSDLSCSSVCQKGEPPSLF